MNIYYGPKCPECGSRNTQRIENISDRVCLKCNYYFGIWEVIEKAWDIPTEPEAPQGTILSLPISPHRVGGDNSA